MCVYVFLGLFFFNMCIYACTATACASISVFCVFVFRNVSLCLSSTVVWRYRHFPFYFLLLLFYWWSQTTHVRWFNRREHNRTLKALRQTFLMRVSVFKCLPLTIHWQVMSARVRVCVLPLNVLSLSHTADIAYLMGNRQHPTTSVSLCILVFFYPSVTIRRSSEATHFTLWTRPTFASTNVTPCDTGPLLSSYIPASVHAKHMWD